MSSIDWVVKVIRNEEVMVLGGYHSNYDDVSIYKMDELINALENGVSIDEIAKELCLDRIDLKKQKNYDVDVVIDFDQKIIKRKYANYVSDISGSKEFPFDVVLKDGKYYADYEGDLFEMTMVEFEDFLLLEKKEFSFDEYKKLSTFVNHYLDYDLIVNHSKIVWFNCAC